MTSDISIRAENLSKSYRIRSGGIKSEHRSLREEISGFVRHPIRSSLRRDRSETIWALRDASFTISQGEVVGIIGRNGAGKSTLLKILSRITEPTYGTADIHGKLGVLLEVGTGFHPELTGRENIFLSGVVIGMKHREIQSSFDAIVAFSGVEQYIDVPVKRYSSGMFTRLAFAVAAHLKTHILLVDEVLAVGDTEFQKKCLAKMDNVSREGRTVLFVSHNLGNIAALCPRSLLLEKGRIMMDDTSENVINAYISSIRGQNANSLRERVDRMGEGPLRFVDAWLENESGQRVNHVLSGTLVKLVAAYEIEGDETLSNIMFGFGISTSMGLALLDLNCHPKHIVFNDLRARSGRVECIIPKLLLNQGGFEINLMARSSNVGFDICDFIQNASYFTVEPGDYFETGRPSGGLIVADHNWRLTED